MRSNQWMVPCLALAAWLAWSPLVPAQEAGARAPATKTAQARPPIDPGNVRMREILEQWATQSGKLTSLSLTVARTDNSGKFGVEKYQGTAMFKAPNLALLDFQREVPAEKGADPKAVKLVHDERIICTGKDVWQYRSKEKQIFIHELGKDQDRALQEGPLPFLFNFRADNARKRYRMVLTDEDKTSYVVRVDPLLKIDQESFSKALIRLDKHWLLPTRVFLWGPAGRDTKDFVLSNIKPNDKNVADGVFVGKRFGPPWKILVNAAGEAAPAAAPAGREAARGATKAAPRQAIQAAPRPGTQGQVR